MNKAKYRVWMVWVGVLFCTVFFGLIDWQTGFELNFFVFYFLPVAVAAWYIGVGTSVMIAVLSALVWYWANTMAGASYSSPAYAVWNTIIRLVSFIAIGWSVATIRKLLNEEHKASETLRKSLAEIRVLRGFLPICAQCKKIRTDQGEWQQMEVYISQHSNAQFSHGYCPVCLKQALAEAGLDEEEPKPSGEA